MKPCLLLPLLLAASPALAQNTLPQPALLTLLYPKWLQGKHGPRGEIEKLTGLQISAGGKRLQWKRDPVDVFAFHIDVPSGAKKLDLEFQFASATSGDQGRIVMTPAMMSLQFNSMSLYPAGYLRAPHPGAGEGEISRGLVRRLGPAVQGDRLDLQL
jgi:hypothetical protein